MESENLILLVELQVLRSGSSNTACSFHLLLFLKQEL